MKNKESEDEIEVLTPEQLLSRYDGVEISEGLKELQGSARELSDEEKRKRGQELENMSSEELAEEFGLEPS